jgi:hypothetical protein
VYINRADNYIQPTYQELQPDNIVMLQGSFLLVCNALPDVLEFQDLLSKSAEIYKLRYDNIIGVDLKNWIVNINITHVIDSLLISNGYDKKSVGFCLFDYCKDGIVIHNAGYPDNTSCWYIEHDGKNTPVSFLHEIQNYFNRVGQPLRIKGAF